MTNQSEFRAGLLDAEIPVPTGLLDSFRNPAGKRYDVYRNNVTHSLVEALKTAFPLVRKLIGFQNFDGLAPLYVRSHAPSTPLMMHYGTDFPSFLERLPQLSHIAYLPDAARLDIALRGSYHAADGPALTPARLQDMPANTLGDAKFRLAPATRIIRSSWPLYDIWRFNAQPTAPKPQAVAQDVLITRLEFDPSPHTLPIGGADWLLAINDGQKLDEAHETAVATAPDFDLSTCLTLALQTGALMENYDKELNK